MIIVLFVGIPIVGGLLYGLWMAGEVGMGPFGGRVRRPNAPRMQPGSQGTEAENAAGR